MSFIIFVNSVLFGSESWFDLCYVILIFGISNIENFYNHLIQEK